MSLRLRLLITMVVVLLVALLAADIATERALHRFLVSRVDASLEAAHVTIEDAVRSGGTFSRESLAVLAPGTHVAIRHADGSTDGPIVVGHPGEDEGEPLLPAAVTGLHNPTIGGYSTGEPRRFLTVAARDGDHDRDEQFRLRVAELQGGEILFLAQSLERVDETTTRLLQIELLVTATALLVAAAIMWAAIRRDLRPLRDVERTAQQITAGDLEHRVPGADRPTEVGHVASALNSMLGRIQDAFHERDATELELRTTQQRLRGFVADASHELRSPVAAVSAYAELFERGAKNDPADLAKVMAGIRSESARMGHLVDELLLLARLDDEPTADRVVVDFAELVADAVHASLAVGPTWPMSFTTDTDAWVLADPIQLRQVVDNLVRNVRIHTPPRTATEVAVRRSAGTVELCVQDHGPGVDIQHREAVFERFFRTDGSRSRSSGGTGLGLAIVSAIVQRHNGTLALTETAGGGARFCVTLPAVPGPPR